MTGEVDQRVRELFDKAVVLTAAEREPYLAAACGTDRSLLQNVKTLLDAHDRSPYFLDDGTRRSPRLGRYVLTGELGRGAMGVVYKAVDPLIGRSVAIKTLRLQAMADPKEAEFLREGLLREAHSAGVLFHPGIVIIFDVGQEGETTFIAMERVEGTSLHDLMESGGRLELPRILDILRQTAEALDYAHKNGVVHRDVKPANIMLHKETTVKIADFGIAKIAFAQHHTMTGMVMGTPIYMSPEQIEARPVDGRSDQFALAVMSYELLTGTRPFAGDSFTSLAHNIVYGARPSARLLNPALPASVDEVLSKALSRAPEDRYPNCAAFVDAVTAVFQQPTKPAAPPAPPQQPPPARRSHGLIAAATVVGVLLAGGAAYKFLVRPTAPVPAVSAPGATAPAATPVTPPAAAAVTPPAAEAVSPPAVPKKAADTAAKTVARAKANDAPAPSAGDLYKDAMAKRSAGRPAEAAALFRQSAELGDARSMVFLASMYAQGTGVPRSDVEAARWYRQAAGVGDTVAMDAMGQLYASGRGVPKDNAEAANWFLKAADNGNPTAKAHLAQLQAASPPATMPSGIVKIAVAPDRAWTDTGIDVNPGDIITVAAAGTVAMSVNGSVPPHSPAGDTGSCQALHGSRASAFPAPALPCRSLIGKVGAAGTPYEIGARNSFQVRVAGRLYLGVNDDTPNDNSGGWTAAISVRPTR